jgi:hypothetical protein
MSHYDDLPAENTPVSAWTLDECSAYVALRDEMHGEQSAEAGMGAMSLGYGTDGAYEAANAVARPESDPDYVAARARLRAALADAPAPAPYDASDDIPF